MPIKKHRPITPSLRFYKQNVREGLSSDKPEKTLIEILKKDSGRNNYGRITSRRRGGRHKRMYRIIDFKRSKKDINGKVISLEYDPNRTSNIALISYPDGEKTYIVAPAGLEVGHFILSTDRQLDEFKVGYNLPLKNMPLATFVHCVEITPGRGAQLARSAGVSAQYVALDEVKGLATLRMPSGEVRYIDMNSRATIGQTSNSDHRNRSLGKAGRNRWLGRRPRVRGVAMNPVDHPNGGGEGKTSCGGHPVSPWGQLAKGGKPTRRKAKTTNTMIIERRNGKKLKKR